MSGDPERFPKTHSHDIESGQHRLCHPPSILLVAGCQRDLSRLAAPCGTLEGASLSTSRAHPCQPSDGTEADMNLAEYDGNRQTADTKSGPVGYTDVGSARPALFVHGVGT